jgi:PTS system fructose-specific IIC component
MNGVSFMLPFVVCGGLLIALALAIGGTPTPEGLQIQPGSFWEKALNVGVAGFKLMIPILAGYIAYSIGDRPALAPAMIGGWIANDGSFYDSQAGAGFLGAIIVGLLVGYFVKWVRGIKVPEMIQPIMPILIVPLLGTIFISVIFIGIIGAPIAGLMTGLNNMLAQMQTGSAVVLAAILGAMLAFDMGGPVNKVAFLFGVSSIASGNTQIMGAVGAAGGVPPLAMALATVLARNKYNEEELNSGKAALAMGLIGISEGAIPFAAKDPFRVLPGIMAGGALAGAIAIKFGITNVVPHTGPIVGVLGAINRPIPYFMAIIVGTIVGAFIVNLLKKPIRSTKAVKA